jgi:hypothetical protein
MASFTWSGASMPRAWRVALEGDRRDPCHDRNQAAEHALAPALVGQETRREQPGQKGTRQRLGARLGDLDPITLSCAHASTSSCVIRPPGPVPGTRARSTPSSRATRRAAGVTGARERVEDRLLVERLEGAQVEDAGAGGSSAGRPSRRPRGRGAHRVRRRRWSARSRRPRRRFRRDGASAARRGCGTDARASIATLRSFTARRDQV